MQRDSNENRSASIGDRRGAALSSDFSELSLLEYWQIFRRRRRWFWPPSVAIALLVIFYVLSLPAIYRAEATILIEDQEIPEDIIGATIGSYASQQIQLISQRLLTVQNIKTVVEKFGIYGDTEEPIPAHVLAGRFREDMELELVSAEMIDPSGRSVEAAVAFTLAFNNGDPEIAQNVTEELVALFLNENQRSSQSRSTGVSELLRSAIEEANAELMEAERKLAEFKLANEGALPELYQLNLNVVNRSEDQLLNINLRIQELQQRQLQLSTELASLSPTAPVVLPSGETVMSDRDRLRALLIDYRRKSAIYEVGHPDLRRLEREIDSLQATVGDAQSYPLIQEQLREERNRLAGLRDRYSESHPDIKSSKAAIAKLEGQLASTDPMAAGVMQAANNPAYILINTQLQSIDLEMKSLLERRRELQKNIDEHEALIKQSQRIETDYDVLLRGTENARTKYSELQARLRAAEVAADVGDEITGQRFSLIEPPVFPLNPKDRHRTTILLLGVIIAIGAGAGLVVLVEITDNSIRSARDLSKITGATPLAVIPYLDNSADVARAKAVRYMLMFGFLAATTLTIISAIFLL